jgi:hypothetical protein
MISGQNKVPIECFESHMNLINTPKVSNELRIRFQLSTGLPTKVTTFWLTVRWTVFEVEVSVEDNVWWKRKKRIVALDLKFMQLFEELPALRLAYDTNVYVPSTKKDREKVELP